MQGIEDSIVVGQRSNGDIIIVLFVVLSGSKILTPELTNEIKSKIRTEATANYKW